MKYTIYIYILGFPANETFREMQEFFRETDRSEK